ncbi:MAG: hypothetical protein WKF41_04205 [Gaiellaceae bacterium]
MRPARLRPSKHLPQGSGEVPYALSRDELRGFGFGQITVALIQSTPWQTVIAPRLDAIQLKRERAGKEKPWYSAHELEAICLLQRVAGLTSYQATRDFLAGDTIAADEARRLLKLDRTRGNGRRRGRRGEFSSGPTQQFDGVPSKATMTRFLRCWDEVERADLYEQLFEATLQEHLEFPEFQEECLTLYGDGSPMLTHYTAPIFDPKSGKIVNAKKVTAPEAGYAGYERGPDKCGDGWNLLALVTRTSLPTAYELPKIHDSERVEFVPLVNLFATKVRPMLDPERVGIITTDGAFHSPLGREAVRDAGYVENIHLCSHADTEETNRRAEAMSGRRIPIDGYPGWFANDHREVICAHGRRAAKVIEPPKRNGRPVVRVEGSCLDGCTRSISIESGTWRRAQNPTQFVRCAPHEPADRRDWALGNGLTFNDPEASSHGKMRFGRNEGFHGAMASRYKLLEKRWFRRRGQVRIEVAMVFSIVHVIAMEYRRRLSEAEGPTLQLAA